MSLSVLWPACSCPTHTTDCYVRTGTSDGPNRGRCFYMCPEKDCKFAIPAEEVKAVMCPEHDKIISIRTYKNGGIRYRCGASTEGKWCGTCLVDAVVSTTASDTGSEQENSNSSTPLETTAPTNINEYPEPEEQYRKMTASAILSEIQRTQQLQSLAALTPDGGRKLLLRLDALGIALKWRKRQDAIDAGKSQSASPASSLPSSQEGRAKVPMSSEGNEILSAEGVAWAQRPAPLAPQSSQLAFTQRYFPALSSKCISDIVATIESMPHYAAPETPEQLATQLLPHQKHALAWMQWREQRNQVVLGGIFGDDMGLGKTLSLIALIVADRTQSAPEQRGPTLIVCPSSLLGHWQDELKLHVKAGVLAVHVYHGSDRRISVDRLDSDSVLLTTYKLVALEQKSGDSILFKTNWRRVILDEGHAIKSGQSQTSKAACKLEAECRWVVSGTPIHNNLNELHSLISFLRCPGLEDLKVWKREVAGNNGQAKTKLNALMSCLLLRRMKDGRGADGQPLIKLPPRKASRHVVKLLDHEREQYDALWKTRLTLTSDQTPPQAGGMLILLLRLRMCCMHPRMVKAPLTVESIASADLEDSLVSALQGLSVAEEKPVDAGLPDRGAKLDLVLELITKITKESTDGKPNKIVIVSQWTKMLDVVQSVLDENEAVVMERVDGTMASEARHAAVTRFNTDERTNVMLLSLLAGGVGLNLCAANHLFLLDAHFNPAWEQQAGDRIYRIGQSRAVEIHTFVCENTIEERIEKVQAAKRELARVTTQPVRLSLSELKALLR